MVRSEETRYLGKVKLRNTRQIYEDSHRRRYVVRSTSRGTVYESTVAPENVEGLRETLRGRSVTVDDVVELMDERALGGLRLRYSDGHKRRYELQDVLIVMCVLGIASLDRHGSGYVYRILDRPAPEE